MRFDPSVVVRRLAAAGLVVCGTLTATPHAAAQFDPARVSREAPPVAARFPDPPVAYPTPAFAAGRADLCAVARPHLSLAPSSRIP